MWFTALLSDRYMHIDRKLSMCLNALFSVRRKGSMKMKGEVFTVQNVVFGYKALIYFDIRLNIIGVLLVSPTKVWPPNVVLKSTHVRSYWWNALSLSFSTNMWSLTAHGTIMGSSLSLIEFFEKNVVVSKEKLFSWNHKDPWRNSIIEIFLSDYKAMQKSRTFVKLVLEDLLCVSLVWK